MINWKNSPIENLQGLSEDEAFTRLQKEGFNELPSEKRHGPWHLLKELLTEPMIFLLIAAAALYFSWGDLSEAILLSGSVFVVIFITFYQSRKTERALEALRDMTSPRARVIRNGQSLRIPGREVVRGDILLLSEGDRIAADATILSCAHLSVDESLLTGESAPVRKRVAEKDFPWSRPGGEDLPFIYSGTLVVHGHAIAQVHSTGLQTELGKIGKSLQGIRTEKTPLQKETARWVLGFAILALLICVLVALVYGFTRANWLEGILAGVTLAMSLIPEEIPVVFTVFLALGAWRMSKKQVLTRRVPALETLGAVTSLCVDKTGTLTLNQMSVAELFAKNEFYPLEEKSTLPLPETFHELIEFAILASQKDPFDPMEKAIHTVGKQFLEHTEHIHQDWTLVREYPLAPDLLALSHVWKSPEGSGYVVAAKGAPEAIEDLCHLEESERAHIFEKVQEMAQQGLRVLGVAQATFKAPSLPKEQHEFEFKFVGLLGFEDPIRPGVAESIQECHRAGIRVLMITGDYPATAFHIAQKIGFKATEQVLTGNDLEKMSVEELKMRIRNVNLFARVMPEQKLKLVEALKMNGEIVAMTGDGVNDAPALKSAHIGIAMGGRGTDVAREAADIVLVNDDFPSIVLAIKMGRRIFDNLKKALAYIFAIHVPIAGLALIPVLLEWPLLLFPVHIVFLELIIDPACSLVFEVEPEERDVMRHPPRPVSASLFNRKIFLLSFLQGASVLVVTFFLYASALQLNLGEDEARTLAFTTLILANLGLILTNRSWSETIFKRWKLPNPFLKWILGGAFLLLVLVLNIPFLQHSFRFSTLHWNELLLCLGAGMFSILGFEIYKLISSLNKPDQSHMQF